MYILVDLNGILWRILFDEQEEIQNWWNFVDLDILRLHKYHCICVLDFC